MAINRNFACTVISLEKNSDTTKYRILCSRLKNIKSEVAFNHISYVNRTAVTKENTTLRKID